MYYKLGQSCVTNWGSFFDYKLGQTLLQNNAAITNWDKICDKLGQLLQIRAIVTNWDITGARFYLLVSDVYQGNEEAG